MVEKKKITKSKKADKKSSKKGLKAVVEGLAKLVERITSTRLEGPAKGEHWCAICRKSAHTAEECEA